ncbi:MAG: hypothetical protein ISS25_03280 [Nanoarchaeota archaeon]|nr:hypothetical protein [DPANN group archaeon]MBL7116824.1 hypothetical protein [Nanoarchaeota archaeon]
MNIKEKWKGLSFRTKGMYLGIILNIFIGLATFKGLLNDLLGERFGYAFVLFYSYPGVFAFYFCKALECIVLGFIINFIWVVVSGGAIGLLFAVIIEKIKK